MTPAGAIASGLLRVMFYYWPLDWIALLVALAALIFARKTSGRLAALQARLDKLEAVRAVAAPIAADPAPLRRESVPARTPIRERRSCRRPCRSRPPASRSASAPAGWSGWAA
jgi:hypothetical protein